MMTHGRDSPIVPEIRDAHTGVITQNKQYSIMSINNPNYRRHSEMTDGGMMEFPTPEMPTHSVRRAIIAALKVIEDRNSTISRCESEGQGVAHRIRCEKHRFGQHSRPDSQTADRQLHGSHGCLQDVAGMQRRRHLHG